ncbi:MAG TPA: sigma-70 family RNA polymerase sigma factor [Iamia sp.]|nr:sigma-70 family RNA polymerase sigma factor [Iamia sp.]
MDRFGDAFDDLSAVAHRVAYRLLGDRSEAEEVAQEALVRVYLRWRRVAPYAEAWVARVATNLALDQHRRRSRQRRHAAAVAATPAGVADDPAAGLVSHLELVEGLRRLPKRQREVVALRYLADISEAETALVLGCAPGTVKQHAHRGLAALRLSLTPPDDRTPRPPPPPSPTLEEDPDVHAPR